MKRFAHIAALTLLILVALASPAFAAQKANTIMNTQPIVLNGGFAEYTFDKARLGQYNPITITHTGKLTLSVEGNSYASGWLDALYITKPAPACDVIAGTTKTSENTKKKIYTMSYACYLEPGEYLVYAGHKLNWADSTYKLKAVFAPYASNEQQPNETPAEAQPLTLPASIKGAITPSDTDCFQFELEGSRKVELSLKQYDQYLSVSVDSEASTDWLYYVEAPEKKMSAATTRKKTLSLPAGKYTVTVKHGLGYEYGPNDEYYQQQHGRYDLKLKVVGAPNYSLVTLKKARVSLGLGGYPALPVAIKPNTLTLPKGLTWKSSKPSVAAVDAASGAITPLAAGKTTVTVTDGFKKASCVLTVGPNQFTRKKPLSGKGSDVYSSTRSLKYEGGELVMEIFVYNKTKYKLRGADYTYVELDSYFDLDEDDFPTTIFEARLDRWDPKNGVLNPGKYEVFTYRIPLTGEYADLANLDIGSGGYQASIHSPNYELTKKSTAMRPRIVPVGEMGE